MFADNDKYKLFAQKVWPVMARCRKELEDYYRADNGRPRATLWERYVENNLDFKSGADLLNNKHRQAGQDSLILLQWLEGGQVEQRYGRQVCLLREVFTQQYEFTGQEALALKTHPTGAIQNPHDPRRKYHSGFRVSIASPKVRWALAV